MSMQPGQTVAHYRLLELIGEGGMGRVYRALDTRLNRQVAIKILLPALTSDEKLRRRFLREARAAAAVSHPTIAAVHEVSESEGSTYIVMEYVEGRTLRQLIDGKPLPLSEALRIAAEIAEGLAEAHKEGVIHRDLKPDNIIVRPDRRPKILDFGIAKLLEGSGGGGRATSPSATSLTGEGRILGTIGYMSPEQARGDPVDGRSDIFSFGVILYQMITGQAPFRGRTPIDTLTSILKEAPPPVAELNPDVPPRVEEMLRECLEKDPDRRYQRMEDLLAALRISKLALQEATLRRTTFEAKVPVLPEPADEKPDGKRGGLPSWAAGLGVLAVALLVVAAFYTFNGSPHPPTTTSRQADRAVAVVGFENLSDPVDENNLGRALMGLITTDLAETGGLSVASTAKVMAALRKAGVQESQAFDVALASEAARLAGAEVMLVGQVSRAGDRMILAAELVDVQSGNTMGSLRREAASGSELISLANAIAAEVRHQLHVEPAGMDAEAFDLARALTSSPEAYRRYAAGELAFHQALWTDATVHFERAIAEDPTFALAYYRLAIAKSWSGAGEETAALLQEGLPHASRLPKRWQILYRAALQWRQGERVESFDALASLAEQSTDIPDVYYLLGEIHTHSSRHYDLRLAREMFETTLDLDPTFKVVFYHLVYQYLDAGDLEAALRLVERHGDPSGDDAAVAEAEVAVLFAQGEQEAAVARGREALERGHENLALPLASIHRNLGDAEAAWELADRAVRMETDLPGLAYMMRAGADSSRGRLGPAISGYRKASESFAGAYDRFNAWSHISRARLLAATGETEGALAAARDALRVDPYFAPGHFWLGRILLGAGRTGEAAETLRGLREMLADAFTPPGTFWLRVLQAEIHRAEGDLGAALAELGRAAALPPEHRSPEVEWFTRARVKAAFGDLPGAIEAYREGLKPRPRNGSEAGRVTPLPLYDLARVEEGAGEIEAARDHYRRFLAMWGEADLPVTAVADAKSRLAALK
jgi:serine/threonine protein kinase/tetratricopeptide (TPR) repeat protein